MPAMLEPFAEPSDVASRWRALSDSEDAVATTLIADASDMIRSRWPNTDTRVAAGTISEDSLTRIVATMVKRAMLVGDNLGLESASETQGPFSASEKYANPTANLYFTAEDVRLLEGRPARRAFAVDLASPPTGCW